MTRVRSASRGFAPRAGGFRTSVVAAATTVAVLLGIAVPGSAAFAADAQLVVSIAPTNLATGLPQTWAGYDGSTNVNTIGYTVSYSCNVSACEDATVRISPAPKDPTYGSVSFLTFQNWTPPFSGATMTGTADTGLVFHLGDLAAGDARSFTFSLNWSTVGSAVTATVRPASYFPNGFPIELTATGDAASAAAPTQHTADLVTWRSAIRGPELALLNQGLTEAGSQHTYTIRMGSGCLTVRDTAMKGDSRYTCAKAYDVVYTLPPQATYVSSTNAGVYDAATHTVAWSQGPATGNIPAIGWYRPGAGGNLWSPRTVTVSYPPENFSPSGTDTGYCNFDETVSSSVAMTMTFISVDPDDDTVVRNVNQSTSHRVTCVAPFGKAIFNQKASTYDGPNRVSNNTISQVVVQPAPDLNKHYWAISVGNQANVPGRAVITEPNLDIEGTRVTQIRPVIGSTLDANASIQWELNTGATGTTTGLTTAPTGTWFVSATVTSGPLAGPNTVPTQSAQTTFIAEFHYEVQPDAPIGQTRTNTAQAKMTYPGQGLSDIDLGSRTHSLRYVAPFGRGAISKSSTRNSVAGGVDTITIPLSGSTTQAWTVRVANTANVDAVATIRELDLGSGPGRVIAIVQNASTTPVTGATVDYVLNTGATGTAAIPFNAPTGTWITSAVVTSPVIPAVNAATDTNVTTSWYEATLRYLVDATGFTTGDSWTNTASATLAYPGMGIADTALGEVSRTVEYRGQTVLPTVTAAFVGNGVVDGGGAAVPGRDVTYTVRGASSDVPAGTDFTPQYVFIAPLNWAVTSGSARFEAGTVPPGATFTYKQATIGGNERDLVIATWPAGTTFGANATWPSMTVAAQPTFAAAPTSTGTAVFWAGEASNNWTSADANFGSGQNDTTDVDGDGLTTDRFATASSNAITVGAAAGLGVVKEICLPDASQADGCEWIAQPDIRVGVDPSATGIRYRVTLANTGNQPLTDVVAYDVLPYVGDSGTSADTASTPRGSTFAETLASVDGSSGVTLAYSASTNPCRAEVYPGGPAGCVDDWNASPAAADGARAIRIVADATLAPGAEIGFTYSADVVPGSDIDAVACNSVAAKVAQIGVATEPPAVCATTQEGDLSIEPTDRLPLQVGRPGVVPFVVTNNGGSLLAPATVTIDVPANVRVADLTPEGWKCTAASTQPGGVVTGPVSLTCDSVTPADGIRALERDQPETLELRVVPLVVEQLCFDAEVSGLLFDPELSNNHAASCQSTISFTTALDITKTDGVSSIGIGEEVTYTIRISSRLAGEELTDVTVVDELPAGLEYVSSTAGGVHADALGDGTGGTVTWVIPALAPTGEASPSGGIATGNPGSTTVVTVTVRATAAVGVTVVNEVSVDAADPALPGGATLCSGDPCTASDTDAVRRLVVTKSNDAAAGGVRVGDTVTYTVVVENAGVAEYTSAAPLVIADDLSEVLDDATFVAGSGRVVIDGGSPLTLPDPVAGVLRWQGPLSGGATVVMTYRVEVGAVGDRRLENVAYVADPSTCVSGADATGEPCAVDVIFAAPTLDKDVLSLTQNADGSWTVVYDITVTNPNAAESRQYSLTDTLRLGTGITATAASVTAAPAGVTPAAWSGSGAVADAVTIPGGETHHYEITVAAPAGAALAAGTACVAGQPGGFANRASLTGPGLAAITADACAEPVAPTIQKTVTAAPSQNADGTWTIGYRIQVTNDHVAPAGGLTYAIDDALRFPSGIVVNDVDATGPGAVSTTFDGDTDTVLTDGAVAIAAASGPSTPTAHTYDVVVNVSAPTGSVPLADLVCAPAGTGGYLNAVALRSGTSAVVLADDEACADIVTDPLPLIEKTLIGAAIDGVTGDWNLEYEIVVNNPSATLSTRYSLDDAFQFAPGATIVGSPVVHSADAPPAAGWDGVAETRVVTDVTLEGGAEHRYTVTVSADSGSITDDADGDAVSDCRLDSGETGTGFRNLATLTAGAATAFADACAPINDPSVVKTTVSAPTQDPTTGLWTIEYDITVTHRSTLAPAPYTLTDTLHFPGDVTVTDVDARAIGGATGVVDSTFDGASNPDILVGTAYVPAAADPSTPATHTYRVTVEFDAPAGLAASDIACQADGAPGGLLNVVGLVVGPDRVRSDAACADVPAIPVPGLAKEVLTQEQNEDGTWTVLYRVTVGNPSDTVATRYDVVDRFAFGAGISVVSQQITANPAGVTVEHGTWNGGDEGVIAEDVLLPAGGTHRYTVRVVIDSESVRGTSAAGDCSLTTGATDATGFLNVASLASGLSDTTASACARAWDPGITKQVLGSPVRNADGSFSLSYEVTVSNPSSVLLRYGLADAFDFPTGTVVDSLTVTGSAGSGTPRPEWDGETDTGLIASGTVLAAGTSHVYRVDVRATLPSDAVSAADGWANTATVSSSTGDAVTSDASAAHDVDLPELEVEKQATLPSFPRIGDVVTYTITVRNVGEGAYTATYPAIVLDDLSDVLDDADYLGSPVVSPAGGVIARQGDRLRWSGPLAAKTTMTITYTVAIAGGGDAVLANTAFAVEPTVTSPTTPDATACTTLDTCARTSTALPALMVEKVADVTVVAPGGRVGYVITLTNTGSVPFTTLTPARLSDSLSDILDDALFNNDLTASSGSASMTNELITWSGALAAGDSVEIRYSVTVLDPIAGDGMLDNTVEHDPTIVTLGLAGETGLPATASTSTGIRDLAYAKRLVSGTLRPGSVATYEIQVENIGYADYTAASPATVVDSLQWLLDDARYNGDASATAGGVTFSSPYLTWEGPIARGDTVTIRYTVTLLQARPGDGELINVVGAEDYTETTSPATCSDDPRDNGRDHCAVFGQLDTRSLATTGMTGLLPLLLAASVLILFGLFALIAHRLLTPKRQPRHG